jgi:hypothetical protein
MDLDNDAYFFFYEDIVLTKFFENIKWDGSANISARMQFLK